MNDFHLSDEYIIQSVRWSICLVPDFDPRLGNNYGKSDFQSKSIFIADNLSPEEMLDTLIHETTHILNEGRESTDLTKEDDVRTFSTMLTDTLIRNGITFRREDYAEVRLQEMPEASQESHR